ncbi:hypothetical protein EOE65_00295 [Neptunomonas marina]|uniref:Porin n=1 Tax=Neptunomonas marina TaxID=1815562 RepID=A0A437QC75_9GAMM|nr:hypothetical protein EOE65_00295 [Neptunomonas marina]
MLTTPVNRYSKGLRLSKLSKGSLLAAGLFSSMSVWADTATDFYWGGFVSQGVVTTTQENTFAGGSDGDISTSLREMAVYGTWRPSSRLHVSGQLMSRRSGSLSDGSPRIDYLLADFRFDSCECISAGARVGRLKIPYGFYNDTRDVPFTRPSIVLPQSIYFDQARDLMLSADGVMGYVSVPFEEHRLDYSLLIGQPEKDDNVEYIYLGAGLSGHFSRALGVVSKLDFSDMRDRWRLTSTLGHIALDYRPGSARELGLQKGQLDIKLATIGAEYNTERWSLTAEYARQQIDWSDLGGIFSVKPETDLESYYLQWVYRFTERWELLLRYDQFFYDRNDRDGSELPAVLGLPAHSQWTKDFTVGLGWQISERLSLRAEVHRLNGTAWLPRRENTDASKTKEDWSLYLLQLAYRF